MRDEGQSQTFNMIVVVGSLAVATSVVSLGMGFVNIMSADAGTRLSALSLAQAKPMQKSPTLPRALRFVDINYIREEITVREDQIASLRQEIDRESKELGIQKRLQEKLSSAQTPDAAEAGGVPMEPQAILREITRLDVQIAELRKRQEDSGRLNVARGLPKGDSAEKPQWIECDKAGVMLQPQATRFSGPELHAGNSPFVASLNSRRAVLLVRPSGFDSCAVARKVLDAHGIEYGLAPVDEAWQLVFRE